MAIMTMCFSSTTVVAMIGNNRADGLCVNRVRKGFGGMQAEMRDTKIVSGEYLGPFRNELTLEIGMFQKMFFASTDDVGRYWMSPMERGSSRNDRLTGKQIKRFQKVQKQK
jgi:hypothetical protein